MSSYSEGQTHQLANALEKAGFTAADLTALGQYKDLPGVRSLIAKDPGVSLKYVIDLDAQPFVPKGWRVEEHIKGGQFEFDSTRIVLHLDEAQTGEGRISGDDLRRNLKGMPVYNANLLDFYLKNPHLIPKEWEGQAVFFWGTIYRDDQGDLFVRYLWSDGEEERPWDCGWLQFYWRNQYPAAIAA